MAWTFGPVFGSPRAARSALEKSDGVRMAAADDDEVADGDGVADGAAGPDAEAVADPPATRGGAQIHIPLPTGAGPLRPGTRGVGGGVAGTGVVLPVEAGGAAGRTPGRLWRGWGTLPVAAVEGGVGEDPDAG
jgi:hypothetical protein